MRKWWVVAAGVCVLGLTLPSAVWAAKNQDRGKAKGQDQAKGKGRLEQLFAKYDANANGVLDDDEKAAVRAALSTDKALKKLDVDRDGALSDDELAALKPKDAGKPGKKNK